MPNILPVNPRPSKAHPEHRSERKKLEKGQSAFGWTEPILLGLMGLAIFVNVEKEVEKHEQKHKEEDEKDKKGDTRVGRSKSGSGERKGEGQPTDEELGSSAWQAG